MHRVDGRFLLGGLQLLALQLQCAKTKQLLFREKRLRMLCRAARIG